MVSALYVGDLHPNVVEANLFELFSVLGTVSSVRVCRDRDTRSSLGYGYVNYVSQEDAIKAIEILNHHYLFGKPIRVMHANKNVDTCRSGIGNLFVKNLSDIVDNSKLEAMFGKFGTILSSKLATEDGNSKGYGYVQFASQASANAAIENLHGTIVHGKQIHVSNFVKKSERTLSDPGTSHKNVFVKNLDQDLTEEFIKLKFSEFGEVANVKLAMDEAGNSKGYGFVNFDNHESAEKATEAMNGIQLGSKTLYVAIAQRMEERQQILQHTIDDKSIVRIHPDPNLYVKNLDDSVDDSALLKYFGKCGTIISAKVIRDKKGTSKGFGFVSFTTLEEAFKALKYLHGSLFHGKPLYVSYAQKKQERLEQLRYQHFLKMAGFVGQGPSHVSTGYHQQYYRSPEVAQLIPSQHGLIQHQTFGLRPGWGPSEFVSPTRPNFQRMPLPVTSSIQIFDTPRQERQNEVRQDLNMLYLTQLQQPRHPFIFSRDTSGQQSSAWSSHLQNKRQKDKNKVPPDPSSNDPQGMGMFSNRLAEAPPEQWRQMLHERLFPLVHQQQPDLASKITEMLVEMDNSEVQLLLDSPESLASKVDELAQLLRFS